MADFCKQCSIEMFGEDLGDLANLPYNLQVANDAYVVICEGCGPTIVNHQGACIDPSCEVHGLGHMLNLAVNT